MLVSISFCFLSACGGGGGGGASPSSSGTGSGTTPGTGAGGATATVVVGVFLDSAVSNIQYKTATQSGTTNALGQFNYVAGETVTFSVGAVNLPPTPAAATITPLSSANTTDMGNNTVLNLLVFLQSLDDDGKPENGITIPDTANAAANAAIEFNVSPTLFRNNLVFTTLVANNSGSITKTPVTTAVALAHFVDTLGSKIGVQDPRPVAVIKAIDPVMVGKTVTLDGTSSTDPKFSSLNYNWTLTPPKDSKAKLSKATGATPMFSIDISGDYYLSLVVDNGTLTSSSTITVKGIDNLFGNSNLHLYGKVTSNNKYVYYLGCLTCDASQAESVCSRDSKSSYGLTSSPDSIWDVNQVYGNPASLYSPWNEASVLQKTPLIFNVQNDIVSLFSTNQDLRNAPIVDQLTGLTTVPDGRAIAFLENIFAIPSLSEVQAALCNPDGSAISTPSAVQAFMNRLR